MPAFSMGPRHVAGKFQTENFLARGPGRGGCRVRSPALRMACNHPSARHYPRARCVAARQFCHALLLCQPGPFGWRITGPSPPETPVSSACLSPPTLCQSLSTRHPAHTAELALDPTSLSNVCLLVPLPSHRSMPATLCLHPSFRSGVCTVQPHAARPRHVSTPCGAHSCSSSPAFCPTPSTILYNPPSLLPTAIYSHPPIATFYFISSAHTVLVYLLLLPQVPHFSRLHNC